MTEELAFDYVPLEAMTEEDWQRLELAGQAGPKFHAIPQLLVEHLMRQKLMHVLRFRHASGLLLLEVCQGSPGHKRLRIVRASGDNVGWVFKEAAALLQHTAREWGCQQIETMVYNPRLAKALGRVGAKAEAVNMVLEVPHGQ